MGGNKNTEIVNSYKLPILISEALEDVADNIKEILSTNDTELRLFFNKVSACGGKMLRASLLFLFAANNGAITENHKKTAATIELIHLGSLLHDDVVDGSSDRRGDKSFNAAFGSKNAVLMGDFLVGKALSISADCLEQCDYKSIFKVIASMSKAELLQSANKDNLEMTTEKYLRIIEGKTAELFALCCRLGCAETSSEEEKSAAVEFGTNFGIGYQLLNDYKNIFDNASTRLPCDLRNGYFTLPIIHCLAGKHRAAIISAIQRQDCREIVEILTHSGSRAEVLQNIDTTAAKAVDYLRPLPDTEAKVAIIQFTQSVLAV